MFFYTCNHLSSLQLQTTTYFFYFYSPHIYPSAYPRNFNIPRIIFYSIPLLIPLLNSPSYTPNTCIVYCSFTTDMTTDSRAYFFIARLIIFFMLMSFLFSIKTTCPRCSSRHIHFSYIPFFFSILWFPHILYLLMLFINPYIITDWFAFLPLLWHLYKLYGYSFIARRSLCPRVFITRYFASCYIHFFSSFS